MRLSSTDVVTLTGVTSRQLGYWHRTGLVKASAKATGHRRYLIPDVVAVKTIKELRDKGCSLQKIRKAVQYLRAHYPKSEEADVLSSLTLLTDGNTVYMLSDADQIMEVLSRQTVLWVVNIGRLIRDTRQEAESLPLEWIETVTIQKRPYRLRLTHDVEDGGYVAQCVELPGAIEQGETSKEALDNGKAAIRSVLAFMAKRSDRRAAARKRRRA